MENAENTRETTTPPGAGAPRPRLSLDWWAVLTALFLSALVWGGLLRRVPW